MKKITKRDTFTACRTLMENYGAEVAGGQEIADKMIEVLDAQIALLDKKSTKAPAEDVLVDVVFNALDDVKYMTRTQICDAIGDAEVTENKITPRLTKLVNDGKIEKLDITVKDSEGKNRMVKGYKRV